MSQNEANEYILGTEREELKRLGLQHQVWDAEARKGWEIAEVGPGQTILDLGAGPGYCTFELAYIAGPLGKVIAVDKSKNYIDFINKQNDLHGLNIETMHCNFDEMELKPNSLDVVYCRWALAWVPNPEEVLEKLEKALVPGGTLIFQEYYDWSTFQIEPSYPMLEKGIKAILQSFYDSPGNINVGKELPGFCYDLGLEVFSIRPMTKLVTPDQFEWQWPATFLNIYMPKVAGSDALTQHELKQALEEFRDLSLDDAATLLCPQMVEVIAVKV